MAPPNFRCIQQYLDGKTRIVTLHDEAFLTACDATLIFPMTAGGPGTDYASGTDHPFQDYAARKLNQIMSESESELDVISDIERTRRGDIATSMRSDHDLFAKIRSNYQIVPIMKTEMCTKHRGME